MQLTSDSWVEIQDANNKRLFHDLARAGRQYSINGTAPITVLLGFSDGVTIKFNGKPFDIEPYTEDGVARFTLVKQSQASEGKTNTGENPSKKKNKVTTAVDKSDVGKTIYDGLCVNCHGIAALATMIPQTSDAVAWEARIAKGIDTLYSNAINGFTGDMGMMPAKGSNPALSDDEVKAAVDYIVNKSGF
jgi:cytochrome c5